MTNMRVATCGDCIHAEICKQVNSGWFSPKNIAYCKAFKDHTKYAEVVRCCDCKHWYEETGWCNQYSHFIDSNGEACHPWESSNWVMFDGNEFCSSGERK